MAAFTNDEAIKKVVTFTAQNVLLSGDAMTLLFIQVTPHPALAPHH